MKHRGFAIGAALIIALALCAPTVNAEVDFKGEQITWIIPFKVGGEAMCGPACMPPSSRNTCLEIR